MGMLVTLAVVSSQNALFSSLPSSWTSYKAHLFCEALPDCSIQYSQLCVYLMSTCVFPIRNRSSLQVNEVSLHFLFPGPRTWTVKVLIYFKFIYTLILTYNKCKNLPEESYQRVPWKRFLLLSVTRSLSISTKSNVFSFPSPTQVSPTIKIHIVVDIIS